MRDNQEFQPKHCLKCLSFPLDIGAFICICIIVGLSSKNPFKSHIIGDIDSYFYSFSNSTFEDDNSTLNHSDTKENITHDKKIYQNFTNYKNLNLRRLVSDSFCTDIRESFVRNKMKRLSYIFDLNYEEIRGISIALLVIHLAFIPLVIIIGVCRKNACGICSALFVFLVWIAKFVLFIIFFHFFEKGDIGKFDDFLDCQGVKKEFFKKKFSSVNKLRKCFIAFTVFNLLSEIFGKVENLCEPFCEGK